jgi:nucleoside-diphosphate-sugar epimerase
MKILVLGGTLFLGRHIVDTALARGHEVTTFNRGRTAPDLFRDRVERLVGDRDGGLESLEGRTFDIAIDTCGYVPRIVDASAKLLADCVEHYTFVSSISVYADLSVDGVDESGPVETLEDPSSEEIAKHYGGLKALCEQAVERRLPGRALHVRAGLIVGPDDPTDRFTYWPRRFAEGGDVLVPDVLDAPTQFIDVRDLAAWILDQAEARTAGAFNVTGPAEPLRFGDLIRACPDEGHPVVVPEAFLLSHDVAPWMEVPLWIPAGEGGMTAVSIRKAIDAGLSCRPLAETIAETLAWWREANRATREGVGLTREKEAAVLRAWAEAEREDRPA